MGGDARRNQPQLFKERKNNCGNQNKIYDRNAILFDCVIDIIRRGVSQRSDLGRNHTTTHAPRNSGAGAERGILRGTRRRHAELRLPALRPKQAGLRFWRRLLIVYPTGHVV